MLKELKYLKHFKKEIKEILRLMYSDIDQIRSVISWRWEQAYRGTKGKDYKGIQGKSWGSGQIHYLAGGNKLIKLWTLSMYRSIITQ